MPYVIKLQDGSQYAEVMDETGVPRVKTFDSPDKAIEDQKSLWESGTVEIEEL